MIAVGADGFVLVRRRHGRGSGFENLAGEAIVAIGFHDRMPVGADLVPEFALGPMNDDRSASAIACEQTLLS